MDKIKKGLQEAKENKTELGKNIGLYNSLKEKINKKDELYWFIRCGIWQWIEERPLKIKSFFQRGWRGWADEDIWGLYNYLSKVIYETLVHLNKHKHGYPSTLDQMTGKYEYDMNRWDNIMEQMIEGFELLVKAEEKEIELEFNVPKKIKEITEKSMQKDFPNWRYATDEEEKKIKEAFELFSKYFLCLWD